MAHQDDPEITELLHAIGDGDPEALNELFTAVYGELRRLAHGQRIGLRGQETLNTTALIHEAYLKLAGSDGAQFRDRGHFFAVACKAMRRILIDRARRSRAGKRGGDRRRIELDERATPSLEPGVSAELLALDEALSRLEALDPRQAQVVECRFFGGLEVAETAEAVGTSSATVKRDWRAARAWLHRELATGS